MWSKEQLDAEHVDAPPIDGMRAIGWCVMGTDGSTQFPNWPGLNKARFAALWDLQRPQQAPHRPRYIYVTAKE